MWQWLRLTLSLKGVGCGGSSSPPPSRRLQHVEGACQAAGRRRTGRALSTTVTLTPLWLPQLDSSRRGQRAGDAKVKEGRAAVNSNNRADDCSAAGKPFVVGSSKKGAVLSGRPSGASEGRRRLSRGRISGGLRRRAQWAALCRGAATGPGGSAFERAPSETATRTPRRHRETTTCARRPPPVTSSKHVLSACHVPVSAPLLCRRAIESASPSPPLSECSRAADMISARKC